MTLAGSATINSFAIVSATAYNRLDSESVWRDPKKALDLLGREQGSDLERRP